MKIKKWLNSLNPNNANDTHSYCDWKNHEQHTRAASCRSRLESQWETPTSTQPQEANTVGGIELKIGGI